MSDKPEVMKLEQHEITEISYLKRGDHLAVQDKAAMSIEYLHHGIYLGTNFQVADFGSNDNYNVRKLDFLLFKGNRRLFKFEYPPDTCNDPETAAKLAEELVENPELWGPYNLQTNNCEHFATRCKVGIAYSIQVAEIKCPKKAVAKSVHSCTFM